MAEYSEIDADKPLNLSERLKDEKELLIQYLWAKKFASLRKNCEPALNILMQQETYYNMPRNYPDQLPDLVAHESPKECLTAVEAMISIPDH